MHLLVLKDVIFFLHLKVFSMLWVALAGMIYNNYMGQ